MIRKTLENILRQVLLHDGAMEYELYKFELEEHTAFWKDGLKKDNEDFVFIVTVNNRDAAMLLIMKTGEQFINEKARSKIKALWKNAYKINIEKMLPVMIHSLGHDSFSVTGVKISS